MTVKKNTSLTTSQTEMTYEYGKGQTFLRKNGTIGTVQKLPGMPEYGDILFYKKRDWKKKRLNEMNQWEFIGVETQGKEKGKWKVQGLHKEKGDYNWFEPWSLMRSSEVTNDTLPKVEQPIKKPKNPISTTKKESKTRKEVKELLKQGMTQADIARKMGVCEQTVSYHAIRIRKSEPKPTVANAKVGDYPIFTYREANDYLDIDLKTLVSIAQDHSITPVLTKNGLMFTESQIERLSELIKTPEEKEKKVTNEELANYGISYEDKPKETNELKEHKATIEMKNYNYKRVIQENLSMIKNLIHQTEALLEKIQ